MSHVRSLRTPDPRRRARATAPRARRNPSATVHLLSGLPTENVERGFERLGHTLPIRAFAAFVRMSALEGGEMGVLLPPGIETSEVVEDWEACDYLASRFGRDAALGRVVTVVDADRFLDQLDCRSPISAHGWGRSARDARSVADIVVGQVEFATHLLAVGGSTARDAIAPLLQALNPSAVRRSLDGRSDAELLDFLPSDPSGAAENEGASLGSRIVPPWLELLSSDGARPDGAGRLSYRRSRPFAPERFGEWIARPPRELVRGKGRVWLGNDSDQCFGYSCAGSVHRVFPVGRWWASSPGIPWPKCETARRRLLERWHPQFGDRRQEIAFVGVAADRDRIFAELDRCLLSEEEALERVASAAVPGGATVGGPARVGLH